MLTCGINNYNNDCYVIASLQLLSRINNISDLIKKVDADNVQITRHCVKKLLNHDKTVNVKKLKKSMNYDNGQHDPFDFLVQILEKTKLKDTVGSYIKKKFYEVVNREQLLNNIVTNKYYSNNITHYYIIELQIENSDKRHIMDILLYQSAHYILKNNVILQEIEYKSKNNSNAYEVVDYYPCKYLIIRLQLFSFNKQKKKHDIDLGYDTMLHVRDKKYKLVSIISHIGNSINSGHYVSLNLDNGTWYCYDDGTVYSVNRMVGVPYIVLYILQ